MCQKSSKRTKNSQYQGTFSDMASDILNTEFLGGMVSCSLTHLYKFWFIADSLIPTLRVQMARSPVYTGISFCTCVGFQSNIIWIYIMWSNHLEKISILLCRVSMRSRVPYGQSSGALRRPRSLWAVFCPRCHTCKHISSRASANLIVTNLVCKPYLDACE